MMETVTLYKTALALHYLGFTMLTGTILADFVASFQFWKLALSDWQKASNYWRMKSKFATITGIGGALLLAGGITMIVIIKQSGPVTPQLWFQLKMIIVLLLILNTLLIGIKATRKIKRLLHQDISGQEKKVRNAKIWLLNFHVIQLVLLLTIFILAAFRFV